MWDTYKYWVLFLDDMRHPKDYLTVDTPPEDVRWCRNVSQAVWYTQQLGSPAFMFLDHDLGGDETAMDYLKWLSNGAPCANHYGEPAEKRYPWAGYKVISANPIGAANIVSLLESWKYICM